MKKLFIAICTLGLALTAMAKETEINLHKGDSIQLSRSCTHYLSGEEIPDWVYDVPITVQQVGSRKYPTGILIKEVRSWVPMESVGGKYIRGVVQEIKFEPKPELQTVLPAAPLLPIQTTEPVAEVPQPVVEEPQPVVEIPQPVVEQPQPIVEVPQTIAEEDWEPQGFRAPEHRLGLGLRGGTASLCQKTDARVTNLYRRMGHEGAIDIEYTFLSNTLNHGQCQIGAKTGVSVAFGYSQILADAITSYSTHDQDGRAITYINSANNIWERDMQLMVEVPVMFALRGTKGFSFAFGPKINIPVAGWYQMNYAQSTIDCYYTDLGVHEINQVPTGRLNGMARASDNRLRTATFNLMMNAELGYEWTLSNGDGLGLLVYGGYWVVSNYKLNSDYTKGFIYVNAPKAGGPEITGNAIMNDCGSSMGYLSAGLKLTYQFRWPVKLNQ